MRLLALPTELHRSIHQPRRLSNLTAEKHFGPQLTGFLGEDLQQKGRKAAEGCSCSIQAGEAAWRPRGN